MSGSNKDCSEGISIGYSTIDHTENSTVTTSEEVGAHTTLDIVAVDQAGTKRRRISTLLQLAAADHIAIVVKGDVGRIDSLASVCSASGNSIDIACRV